MKKLSVLHLFTAGLVLAVALGLFPGLAQAYVYDDFTGSEIDTNRWRDINSTINLFSQHDGFLYFSDASGGQIDGLRSTSRWTTPFSVSMYYTNFATINSSTGQFEGSGPVLWIGDSTSSVRVYYFASAYGEGFRAISLVNTTENGVTTTTKTGLGEIFQITSPPAPPNSAWLGIDYNGTQASLWFDAGPEWQGKHVLAMCEPDFTNGSPFFGIVGANAFGQSLSFQVDTVQVVPLPATVLLLGSGLLRLAWYKRRKKS